MGPLLVVVSNQFGQGLGALVRGAVGPAISPAAEQGSDEALGLSVGFRAIGSSAQMAQAEALTGPAEAPGDVARAVVRDHPLDANAALAKPAQSALEEADGGLPALVGEHLDVGETGGVVDGDVGELPAGAIDPPGAIAMDAMAHAVDLGQGLDVEVQELAGPFALVATRRWLGIERDEPPQPLAAQDRRDR